VTFLDLVGFGYLDLSGFIKIS